MKNIRSFNDYNDNNFNLNEEDINESLKGTIVGGLLSLITLGASGQRDWRTVNNVDSTGRDSTYNTITRKYDYKLGNDYTKSMADSEKNELIKQGWRLDSEKLDTLYREVLKSHKEAYFISTVIRTDTTNFFESGKFELNPKLKQDIDKVLDSTVKEKVTLVKIHIESSTDKQRVSPALQAQLKKLGFTPDNSGLSKARSEEIKKYLNSKGVGDSLIEVVNLVEQGDSISAENRYVKIGFSGCCGERIIDDGVGKEISTVNYTTYMSKTWAEKKEKKKFLSGFHFPTIRINLGGSDGMPRNRGSLKCPRT